MGVSQKLGPAAAIAALTMLCIGYAMPAVAQECTAVPQAVGSPETGYVVSSVTVTCAAGNTTKLFATSFTDAFGGTVVTDPGDGDSIPPTTVTYPTVSYDGNGNDTITVDGGTLSDASALTPLLVFAGNADGGVYRLDVSDAVIETLGGDDTFIMNGGTIVGGIVLGAGADTFRMAGGSISGSVLGDNEASEGNDTFVVSGGAIGGSIFAGGGADTVTINDGASIGMAAGQLDSIGLESGDDLFQMNSGTLSGGLSGGSGNDRMTIAGGVIAGYVHGNEGNDLITITGGDIAQEVNGNEGDDTLVVSGGVLRSNLSGSDGNDTFRISGGTIGGNVTGDAGDDNVTVSGGTIGGGIDAESVTLLGGTIGGDITGLSGNTLTINAANLNLRNGVLFQGTNAVGRITSTDLARAAGGVFSSQNFTGFDTVSMQGSTLGFAGGSQQIGNLSVLDNSTLFVSGLTTLSTATGGRGNLTVSNAAINMINGSTADVFNVGGVSLNNAVIGIDLDAQQSRADQLAAVGVFSSSGNNVIQVNIVGAPQFANAGVIAIAPVAGEIVPQGGTPSPLFTVAGLPATPGALFDFSVINGSNGGLYLVVVPVNVADPLSTQSAVNASVVDNVNSTVGGILGDAVLTHLGLLAVASRSDAAPNFGVYASGQLARTNHDGFEVSGSNFSGRGPSFTADDFSLAASVELDAAAYLGIDQAYGLDVGLFGGYASSDVTMDPTLSFDDVGEATNKAGMIGTYGLFRKGTAYGLVSATGFFGGTDIDNYILNSTGSYDTAGIAVTGSVGKVFPIGDNWRFDVRGGLLGVNFQGDSYQDSQGNDFGKSRISFGAVKFEPGLFGQYVLEDKRVVSPYVRLELQQRFAYENTGSLDNVDFTFDDSDFSGSLSTGINYQITPTTTLSTEIRGKLSSDSDTLAGKLGIKARF